MLPSGQVLVLLLLQTQAFLGALEEEGLILHEPEPQLPRKMSDP